MSQPTKNPKQAAWFDGPSDKIDGSRRDDIRSMLGYIDTALEVSRNALRMNDIAKLRHESGEIVSWIKALQTELGSDPVPIEEK